MLLGSFSTMLSFKQGGGTCSYNKGIYGWDGVDLQNRVRRWYMFSLFVAIWSSIGKISLKGESVVALSYNKMNWGLPSAYKTIIYTGQSVMHIYVHHSCIYFIFSLLNVQNIGLSRKIHKEKCLMNVLWYNLSIAL